MTEEPLNLVSLAARIIFKNNEICHFIVRHETIFFAYISAALLIMVSFFSSRRLKDAPARLQACMEIIVESIDSFVVSILGPKGRHFTPFIGTLFLYILTMNLIGLIPLFKSPTSSWSTTLALAICVFIYLQYTALKELGVFGYFDHMLGNPRSIIAFSVIIPIFMFFLHILSELVRPISLSLRLRSTIWGDEMILSILAGFGLPGLPLLFFNIILSVITALVQTVVFCLLVTVYFALVLKHENEKEVADGL